MGEDLSKGGGGEMGGRGMGEGRTISRDFIRKVSKGV